mmetsp:Transcript_60462/g.118515  ORF Transcript_60462/g.118515 Transcript_60462/m.118515 type:complete len:288 (-) Transcript_60462:508-1371(-)
MHDTPTATCLATKAAVESSEPSGMLRGRDPTCVVRIHSPSLLLSKAPPSTANEAPTAWPTSSLPASLAAPCCLGAGGGAIGPAASKAATSRGDASISSSMFTTPEPKRRSIWLKSSARPSESNPSSESFASGSEAASGSPSTSKQISSNTARVALSSPAEAAAPAPAPLPHRPLAPRRALGTWKEGATSLAATALAFTAAALADPEEAFRGAAGAVAAAQGVASTGKLRPSGAEHTTTCALLPVNPKLLTPTKLPAESGAPCGGGRPKSPAAPRAATTLGLRPGLLT